MVKTDPFKMLARDAKKPVAIRREGDDDDDTASGGCAGPGATHGHMPSGLARAANVIQCAPSPEEYAVCEGTDRTDVMYGTN
jgi:hypothetical protein